MEELTKRRLVWTGFVLGLLLITLLPQLPVFKNFEARSWDMRQRVFPSHTRADTENVVLVVVDQAGLDEFAKQGITWPWPRQLYGPLISFLEAAGARALGFDVLFTETSVHGVSDDQALAEVQRTSTLPIVHALVARRAPWGGLKRQEDFFDVFPSESFMENSNQEVYASATIPVPELLTGPVRLAHVNATADDDGIFRKHSLQLSIQGRTVSSLPLALAKAGGGIDPESPLLDSHSFYVDFSRGKDAFQTFNAIDVIRSARRLREGKTTLVPAEAFKDAYVVVGLWAEGLHDIRPYPVDRHGRGVTINAHVLSNLLSGRTVQRLDPWLEWIYQALLVSIGVLVAVYTSGLWLQAGMAFLVLLAPTVLSSIAAYQPLWLPLVYPTIAILVVFVFSYLQQQHYESEERRFLRRAFEHYLSPPVIEQLVASPEKLSLGGERRELSILFSDLAGFTRISEQLHPEQLSELLNVYLSAMTAEVLSREGTLDKYEGDAILAFWNAPLEVPEHASKAVGAALSSVERLASLNNDIEKRFDLRLRMRIGIHTGEASVGNFGAEDRFDYTVIGDAANLASRLEGANKFFGTEILISSETERQLPPEIRRRKVGAIKVVGREEVVEVFEPLSSSNAWEEKDLKRYHRLLELIEEGSLQEATDGFRELPSDSVVKLYQTRLEELSQNGVGSEGTRSSFNESALVWELSSK